jgi:hypothetical protein
MALAALLILMPIPEAVPVPLAIPVMEIFPLPVAVETALEPLMLTP